MIKENNVIFEVKSFPLNITQR